MGQMTEHHLLLVQPEDAGCRADVFIADHLPGQTRSSVQKLMENGYVTLEGELVNKKYQIRPGDELTVEIPPPVGLDVLPEEMVLDIVYEDEDMLVVNKPKGMVVHPAAGNQTGTLVNALLSHCAGSLSGIGGVVRPGIVHRIDKDTSGLLLVAKNDMAHQSLAEQIKAHSCRREYEAVVHGVIKDDSGTIDVPIGRHPTDRKKMCVTERHARQAVTHYEVAGRYDGFTHLRLRLETGRTHQIRVHMQYIGHPVAGDPVYGPHKKVKSLDGQCLHARTIGCIHPRTGKKMTFTSELPQYFTDFLRTLRPLE